MAAAADGELDVKKLTEGNCFAYVRGGLRGQDNPWSELAVGRPYCGKGKKS